ncbi:MAG: MFS transporter [Oscillospiraceae bacterium]|nr:MFS transporter [Oscillospiraceae bacterium]
MSTALIQLSKGKKTLVSFGAIMLTVAVACYGLALMTLVPPILQRLDGMAFAGLVGLCISLGITLLSPIGGKLGDIFGRKAVVIVAGLINLVCGIGIAFASNVLVLLICCFGVGFSQGAYVSAPSIIMGLINDRKNVPKAMGYLTMALSIGGTGGSILAGILTDMGMLNAAILFPAIPLVLGIVFIGLCYPNDKSGKSVSIDYKGIVLMALSLPAITLSLSGSTLGWSNLVSIIVFVVGVLFAAILIKHESSIEQPIIPIKLFKERDYLLFLLVGAICYFGRGAFDNYAPLGAQEVIKTSVALSGSLQLPKTILTMFVPAIAGVWMAKKKANMWKAMFVATLLFAIPLLAMGFTVQAGWYIWIYFAVITISGIAESFRGISFTPAAQSVLKPEDMGIGTSMINFANSLVASIAAAIYSAIYGMCTASGVTADTVQKGVNGVFLTAGIVTVVGVVIVLTKVRPMLKKEEVAAE